MEKFFPDQYGMDNLSTDYDDVLSQLQQLDRQIHKLKKKKKGAKSQKKRKLKRRVKELELEYQQLRQFTFFFAYQCKTQFNQQPWWQGAVCNTLPKVFDLVTATVNKLPDKTRPLYITDGSNRK